VCVCVSLSLSIYMSTVKKTLAYKNKALDFIIGFYSTPETESFFQPFSIKNQKAAVREDPGSFREEKREEKTVEVPLLSKKPQSGKIREVSGKRNGKRETAFHKNPQSGKIREDSGKNSGKRCEHCKTCFDSVSMCF
jgi:hypothetical protein